jgi:hypothetical protein
VDIDTKGVFIMALDLGYTAEYVLVSHVAADTRAAKDIFNAGGNQEDFLLPRSVRHEIAAGTASDVEAFTTRAARAVAAMGGLMAREVRPQL